METDILKMIRQSYVFLVNGEQTTMIIGEEKGRGTKNKLARNFGMPSPEGYRKALRAAKLAEKFHIPILMLVDTQGAYPGLGAEERGQSEAIARNLQEFAKLKRQRLRLLLAKEEAVVH